MDVLQAQKVCLDRHIPFYSYRLPGEHDVFFGAQLRGWPAPFTGLGEVEGFTAVPFHERENTPSFFIRRDAGFCNEAGYGEEFLYRPGQDGSPDRPVSAQPPLSDSWPEYRRKIHAMLAELRSGEVGKLVLARNIRLECDALATAPMWFGRLARACPDAFVFLVSVPGTMCWMGATPEIFLQQDGREARTMALAGTRPRGTVGPWGEKEMEEQQIVARYIASLLKGHGEWSVDGPFTKPAGGVEHLCNIFRSHSPLGPDEVRAIRLALHPTPAVGGFPTCKALPLLEEIEGLDRRYYAGYIGPVYPGCRFRWFVNLRSMELFPDAVSLYVGGGITALSDPHMEWAETVLKSRTLLDVIL